MSLSALEILTATDGGEYAQLGTEIKKFLRPDAHTIVTKTDGAIDNIQRVIRNPENRIFLAYVSGLALAAQKDEDLMNLQGHTRILATLYDEAYYLLYLLCRSDICHTRDVCRLANKRVYGGRPYSGTRIIADEIHESNECLRGQALDFTTYEHLSFQSAADHLKAGKIDAAFFGIRKGAELVRKFKASDIVAIELFLKDVDSSRLKGRDRCMAPYGNPEDTINTMCSKAVLLADKNLPSHLVHRLLTGLYDDELSKQFKLLPQKESHDQSSDFKTIPIHEAAERFYIDDPATFEPRWEAAVGMSLLGLILIGIGLIIRRLGRRVFIGHGHSTEWLKLDGFLRGRIGVRVEEFNRVSPASINTTQRLKEMLNASQMAFLILTGEDFHADSLRHPRQNVVHEIGLFQGGIGFQRAIILLEEGCKRFTNIEGLTFIPFPSGAIEHAFEEVRKVLEREGLT